MIIILILFIALVIASFKASNEARIARDYKKQRDMEIMRRETVEYDLELMESGREKELQDWLKDRAKLNDLLNNSTGNGGNLDEQQEGELFERIDNLLNERDELLVERDELLERVKKQSPSA